MTMMSVALGAGVASAQTTSAAAPAATAPAQPTSTMGKIGYINAQAVLAQAPGAAEARTTLQKETDKHRADLALADDSIKNMITAYQQKQLAMSADVRQKQQADIQARQQALQDRADQLDQQMQKRQEELLSRSWIASTRFWPTCAKTAATRSSSIHRQDRSWRRIRRLT